MGKRFFVAWMVVQALNANAANSVLMPTIESLLQASEQDSAQAITVLRKIALAQATEQDSAASFTIVGSQTLSPMSDVSDGAWLPSTGVDLYSTIDESVADDADYNYTRSPSTMEVALSGATDPLVSTGHVAKYRLRGDGLHDMTIQLKQGAVVIASWTETAVPLAETTYSHLLSGAEANSITNYNDLRYNVAAS